MRGFLRRILGRRVSRDDAAADAAVPPLKSLHVHVATSNTHVHRSSDMDDDDDNGDSGYESPGLLDVAAISGLSSPTFSFSSRNATASEVNSPTASRPPLSNAAGPGASDKAVAAGDAAAVARVGTPNEPDGHPTHGGGGSDAAVDDFLNNVIAGNTDVLRKQLAQQKLEAAAEAAAALAAQKPHGNNSTATTAAARSRQGSTQNSFAGGSGPRGSTANTPTCPAEGKALPSQQPSQPSAPAVPAATNNAGSSQAAPPPPHAPSHRHKYVSSAARSLQDYELIAFLGSGTFAEVTLARNKITKEYFAVKKISKQRVKEEGCVERTFTERQLLANLHHPFLVRLCQAFQSQTHLYLVLDFAQGGDLFYLHKQQIWLRSMRRVLVKMQYPYYQSTSSTFAVVQTGSNRASPAPPLLPSSTSCEHEPLHHHLQSSSSSSASPQPHPDHGRVSSPPNAAAAAPSLKSSADDAPRGGPQSLLATPPLRSPPAGATDAAARRGDADPMTTIAAAASHDPAHAHAVRGCGGGGFTTTRTMTGATVTSSAAQTSRSPTTQPAFASSHQHLHSGSGSGGGAAHNARLDGSAADDDEEAETEVSEFDLTDINNSIVGPDEGGWPNTSFGQRPQKQLQQQRRRPPPDFRYYTTDAVDEFDGSASTVAPHHGDGAVVVASPSSTLSGTTPPTTTAAGVTAAADRHAEHETSGVHAAGPQRVSSNGGEDASSVSLNAPSATATTTAAAAFLLRSGASSSSSSTHASKGRYRRHRTGRTSGDAPASNDDDEDAEARKNVKGAVHPGEAMPSSASSSTALTSNAPPTSSGRLPPLRMPAAATRRRLTDGGSATPSSTSLSGETAATAAAGAAARALEGSRHSLSSTSATPVGVGLTDEDNSTGRDGETASAPFTAAKPPPTSLRQQQQQPSLSQRARKLSLDRAALAEATAAGASAVEGSRASAGKHGHHHHHDRRHQHRSSEAKREKKKAKDKTSASAQAGSGATAEDADGDAASAASPSDTTKKSKAKKKKANTVSSTSNSAAEAPSVSGTSVRGPSLTTNAIDTAPGESAAQGSAVSDNNARGGGGGGDEAATTARSPATPAVHPMEASPARQAAAKAAAAHVDLAAPFHQVGMESSETVLREPPPSARFAPDDSHRLPLRLVAFYAVEVALVLQYLHSEGFLYRDLKPENILMRGDGHVMLTDFGVAKYRKGAVIASATGAAAGGGAPAKADNPAATTDGKANSFTGTTQYMSPEMLRGLPHDSRTDWWSYGCVLFEWANGRKAFDGANQFSLFRAIVEDDVKVAADDYRLTVLEVHSRVAQLHYRSEELRMEYEERAARRLRNSRHSAVSAAVVYNRESHSFDVSLLSPPSVPAASPTVDLTAEGESSNEKDGKEERAASPAQQRRQQPTATAASSPSTQSVTHGSGGGSGKGDGPPRRTEQSSLADPRSDDVHAERSGDDKNRNLNSGNTASTTNANESSGSVTGAEAVAALLNDSFAGQRGGGDEGSPPHARLGDSFNTNTLNNTNNSFASVARNSVFSLGGTPTNLSLRLTTTEDGSIAALVSLAAPSALRERQRRERQLQSRRRRARLSCLAIDPLTRDRYIEDALHQMEEAQALLRDLTLKLLDRAMESRLAGADVLEHPFFTCPYVVSQLYYRVYQQRSLAREMRKSGPIAAGSGTHASFTDLTGSMRVDGLSGGSAAHAAAAPAPVSSGGGILHPSIGGSSPAQKSAALRCADSRYGSFAAPSSLRRPDDWRRLFLERRIRALYIPRLRTRDDLRYFPAAVTATGLSAAVEQHRLLKEAKEQQKERLRASKATPMHSSGGTAAAIPSSITGTLSAAHGPLGAAALQAAGEPVVVVPMDAEAAHQIQQLVESSSPSHATSREENDRTASSSAAAAAAVTDSVKSNAEANAVTVQIGGDLRVPAVEHSASPHEVAATTVENFRSNNSNVGGAMPTSTSADGEAAATATRLDAAHPSTEPMPAPRRDDAAADATGHQRNTNSGNHPATSTPSAATTLTPATEAQTTQRAAPAATASTRSPLSPSLPDEDEGEEDKPARGDVVQLMSTAHRAAAAAATNTHTNADDDDTSKDTTAVSRPLVSSNVAAHAPDRGSGPVSRPAVIVAAAAAEPSTSTTTATVEGMSTAGTVYGADNTSLLDSAPTATCEHSITSFISNPKHAATTTTTAESPAANSGGAALASPSHLLDRAATLPQSFVDAALAAAAAAQRKLQQQQPALASVHSSSMVLQRRDAGASHDSLTATSASPSLRRAATAPLEGYGSFNGAPSAVGAGPAAVVAAADGAGGAAPPGGDPIFLIAAEDGSAAAANAGPAATTTVEGDDAGAAAGAPDRNSHNSTEEGTATAAEVNDGGETAPHSAAVALAGGTHDAVNSDEVGDGDGGGGGGYYEQDALAEEPHAEEDEDGQGNVSEGVSEAARTRSPPPRTVDNATSSTDTSLEGQRQQHHRRLASNPLSPDNGAFDASAAPQEGRRRASLVTFLDDQRNVKEAAETAGDHELPRVVPVTRPSAASLDVSAIPSSHDSGLMESTSTDAVGGGDSGEGGGGGVIVPHDPGNDTAAAPNTDTNTNSSGRGGGIGEPSVSSARPLLTQDAHGHYNNSAAAAAAAESRMHAPLDDSTSSGGSGGFGDESLTNPLSSLSSSQTPQDRLLAAPQPQHQLPTSVVSAAEWPSFTTTTADVTAASLSTASPNASPTPAAAAATTTATATAATTAVIGTATTDPARSALGDVDERPADAATAINVVDTSPTSEDALAATCAGHDGFPVDTNGRSDDTVVGEQRNADVADRGARAGAPTPLPPRPRPAEAEEERSAGVAAAAVVDDANDESDGDEGEVDEGGYETSGGDEASDGSSDDGTGSTTSSSSSTSGSSSSTSSDSDEAVSEGERSDTEEGAVTAAAKGGAKGKKKDVSSHSSSKAPFAVAIPPSKPSTSVTQRQGENSSHDGLEEVATHRDDDSDDATSASMSSSLTDSANSTISAASSSSSIPSSHSLSQRSASSSAGKQRGGGGYDARRSLSHDRTRSVSGARLLSSPDERSTATAATSFTGGSESGQLEGVPVDGDAAGGPRSPVAMVPLRVAAGGVNASAAPADSPGRFSGDRLPRRFGTTTTTTTTVATVNSASGSPISGVPWMSRESLSETGYFGDALNPDSANRTDFFGPLTTLPGIAYHLDDETSGASVAGTPLASSANLSVAPEQQQQQPQPQPPSTTASAVRVSPGVGPGSSSSGGGGGGGGPVANAGRYAKTLWTQQQRKRINRELQLQRQEQTSQPPQQQQQQQQPLPSGSTDRNYTDSARSSPLQTGGASQPQQRPYSAMNRAQPSVPTTPVPGSRSAFGTRGDHDEFVGFTFMDRGTNVMMQHAGRTRNNDSFDPFNSANDVNAGSGGNDNDGVHRDLHGRRVGRGSESSAFASPHYPPAPRYQPAPNASSSANTALPGGGGGDHFHNFSFTSPQIMQQYLASAGGAAGGRGGGGAGDGRPSYGQQPRR
ncbi:putative serine/threonine-protein kinase putativeprotein kinase [Leptomonas pyrrhocoris]|uniref:non-specific serine/threonine protein kinase n=1 Tax=Leptomonas pyrrhocoris TaxID=157538 RepID=A0A0N0VCT1_LEPPY|nr:putative serine/threonine-protein kinase putativeprotein kinase [Leptomonas pyrrhocoris]KPA73424.1 putative serine/threonine-protein kinase putativeprotein kinase [Leptomonas pyrrhocoris]|eukprot:XP_015651863.1 putative serine/threonine-protein kinase putativeprotein kinase [Leptomonas pyrrhocoris]